MKKYEIKVFGEIEPLYAEADNFEINFINNLYSFYENKECVLMVRVEEVCYVRRIRDGL